MRKQLIPGTLGLSKTRRTLASRPLEVKWQYELSGESSQHINNVSPQQVHQSLLPPDHQKKRRKGGKAEIKAVINPMQHQVGTTEISRERKENNKEKLNFKKPFQNHYNTKYPTYGLPTFTQT